LVSLTIERIGFTKGAMPSRDPSVTPVDALWEARNVRIDESGVLRIRGGHQAFTESLGPGPVQGAASAFGDILMAWNRNLYRVPVTGVPSLIGSGVMGAQATDPVEFIRWSRSGAEIVYIFTGAGLYETNGSTVSLVAPYTPATGEPTNLLLGATGGQDTGSGPAKCRSAVLRASLGQRLAAAGNPGSPNTVYLSAPLDATYWPSNQVIQLPDDGGRITALANWYNALVIFRDRDIWAFFGADATDTNAVLVVQTSSVGCTVGRTVADVPGLGIVFLGPDNVYALRGVTAIENRAEVIPVADDIRRLLLRSLAAGTDGACATYFDREYRLSLPASNQQERVFRLGLQNAVGWLPDTYPRAACYIAHRGVLYAGLWTEGRLIRADASWLYDNLEGIPFYAAFRREGLGPGPARIRKLYLYIPSKARQAATEVFWFSPAFGEGTLGTGETKRATVMAGTEQHVDVTLIVDGQQFRVKEFQVNVQREQALELRGLEPVRVLEARFHPSLQGHFAQLRISAQVPGEDVAFLGYGIEYEPRRTQRGKEV